MLLSIQETVKIIDIKLLVLLTKFNVRQSVYLIKDIKFCYEHILSLLCLTIIIVSYLIIHFVISSSLEY